MGNIQVTLQRLLKNKNTVTIIGVIVIMALLYFGYKAQIDSKVNPVQVPVARETIQPKTLIKSDMIDYVDVAPVVLGENVLQYDTDIIGKYTNYNTVVPQGSMFYEETVVSKDELPDSSFVKVKKGEVVYNFPVDMDSTYGNSIFPGNKIDIYMKAEAENGQIMVGKLIRDVIKEYLLLEKMEVTEAENGLEAIEKVKEGNFDIIIMDIMMPKMDGYSACREIKKIKDIPFIMLSARGEEYDKLIGFDLGIDDYVTKPFSPKELVARIKAVTKRNDTTENIYEIKGIKLDNIAHDVFVDGKKIYLTPKEYELLKYFIDNKNIALSRENLLSNIWGYDFYGDDRTIDTHVKTLRKHLGKYKNMIVTIRGMGYKFEYEE